MSGTIELGRSYARARPAFAFSALLPLFTSTVRASGKAVAVSFRSRTMGCDS